jgi:23S rRNA U2552 (ribose-2'-O)-methylase RlmE/FtsJ
LGYVKEKDIYSLFVDTDLIILPYNTPGGHSGVLEQAMFYEIPTVAIDFPEYKEQSENVDFVTLTSQENLEKTVEEILLKLKRRKEIKIKSKIIETMNNMRELIL